MLRILISSIWLFIIKFTEKNHETVYPPPEIAKALAIAGFSALSALAVAPAQANILTFDTTSPTSGGSYCTAANCAFSEQGYDLTGYNFPGVGSSHINDGGVGGAGTLNWHSGGDNQSVVGFDLSRTGGGLFDLFSLDTFAGGSNNLQLEADYGSGFSVVGTYNSGTSTALNLLNVQSVRFTDLSNSGVAIDNVNLTAAAATSVPEPFTIIGTLIGGTAAARMRKKLKQASK
jgi:hypothetical protein